MVLLNKDQHNMNHSKPGSCHVPPPIPNGSDGLCESGGEGCESSEIVTLNVGGKKFETSWSTLLSIPNTRLAELNKKNGCFNQKKGEFFFDRNASIFESILDFYRSGELHFPHNYCGPTIRKELTYWRIEECDIAPCCWHMYREYEEKQKIFDNIEQAFESKNQVNNTFTSDQLVAPSKYEVWKRRTYLFLEEPMSSRGAKIWTVSFLIFVLMSIGILCMETHPLFRVRGNDGTASTTAAYGNTTYTNISPPATTMHPLWHTHKGNIKFRLLLTTKPAEGLEYLDTFCAFFFTVEFLLRFFVCPDKLAFWKSGMNIIDVLCVAPMWIKYLLVSLGMRLSTESIRLLPLYFIIMILRVLRICRVLRLARHYVGVKILLLALKASLRELCMLLIFVFIVILIFAIIIFYAEFFEPDTFESIPHGFWWAIITLTTVGYGDMYPKGVPGYIVGACCALTGILATGLPVPIIASNFNLYYSHAQLKDAVSKRKTTRRSLSTLTQVSSDPKRESYLLKEEAV